MNIDVLRKQLEIDEGVVMKFIWIILAFLLLALVILLPSPIQSTDKPIGFQVEESRCH